MSEAPDPAAGRVPWRQAWERALYGPGGFFLRERPGDHFRTPVTASPVFAAAVRELAGRVDDALGRPDPYDVVDLGAGRGELLHALPDVPARWRLTAVERAPDPGTGLRWRAGVPELTGLLVACEWLDAVPLDVVEGGRLVLVGEDGSEEPGPPAPAELLAWADREWPGGGRVEVGLARDEAWAAAVARVRRGLALAVDYGTTRAHRRPTLLGYRAGRAVPPVPDGSADLTAHVALDSCAARTGSRLVGQREALRALGTTAALPTWRGEPGPYAAALARAASARALLDPSGWGAYGWVLHERAMDGRDVLREGSS